MKWDDMNPFGKICAGLVALIFIGFLLALPVTAFYFAIFSELPLSGFSLFSWLCAFFSLAATLYVFVNIWGRKEK